MARARLTESRPFSRQPIPETAGNQKLSRAPRVKKEEAAAAGTGKITGMTNVRGIDFPPLPAQRAPGLPDWTSATLGGSAGNRGWQSTRERSPAISAPTTSFLASFLSPFSSRMAPHPLRTRKGMALYRSYLRYSFLRIENQLLRFARYAPVSLSGGDGPQSASAREIF